MPAPRRPVRDVVPHGDDWLITYADTVTLLLCLVVIILVVRTGLTPSREAPREAGLAAGVPVFARQPEFPPRPVGTAVLAGQRSQEADPNAAHAMERASGTGWRFGDTGSPISLLTPGPPTPAVDRRPGGIDGDDIGSPEHLESVTERPPERLKAAGATRPRSAALTSAQATGSPAGSPSAAGDAVDRSTAESKPPAAVPPVGRDIAPTSDAQAPVPRPYSIDTSPSQLVPVATEVGERIRTLRMPSAAFFASGEAVLGAEGKAILRTVAATLNSPAFISFRIRIEGHTDDTPISNSRFQSNWELSTARAAAVVHFLLDQGIPAERLAAAGYADTFPLVPNRAHDGTVIPENQATNRRVVIRLERPETAD